MSPLPAVLFRTGTSQAKACEFEGRTGTCKEVFQCPEHRAHLRDRDRESLVAAKSNCGTKVVEGKSRPVPLLVSSDLYPYGDNIVIN